MPAPDTDQPPLVAEQRLLSAGLAFAVLAATLQTVIHLANAALVESRQLNANLEGNVFAWAGTVSTFAVSFVALVAAVVLPHLRMRFAVIAAVTAFFSLDDMVQIHERLGAGSADSLGLAEWFDSLLWPALYLPLLAVAAWLLLRLARAAPKRPRRFVEAGLGLLVLAVTAEAVSASWTGDPDDWAHVLEGAVEEAAELAAWVLIAAGLTVIAGRQLAAVSRS